MTEHVDWYEGLFLYPHHLQARPPQVDGQFVVERQLHLDDAYGVLEAELKPQALGNALVEFPGFASSRIRG